MEGNWKPTQPEASMDAGAASGDWRTQLQPEARQRIVNKIMGTLKRHLPISVPEGLNELRKIAIRFEEKIYTAATSQSDYLRKISMKMLSMETKTQQTAPINPAMPNAGAVNQNPADTVSELDKIVEVASEPVPEKGSAEEPTSCCRICLDGGKKRQEPTFSCPICMLALASPISTLCGHIFCEVCIMSAIKRRKECPTCRTKLMGRNNIHRVFLPSTD